MLSLIDGWTFSLPLPSYMNDMLVRMGYSKTTKDTEWCSKYNNKSKIKTATLHGPMLHGLDCLENCLKGGKGGCGTQDDEEGNVRYFTQEFPKEEKTSVVVYNPRTGEFLGVEHENGKFMEMEPIEKGKNTGKLLWSIFAFASMIRTNPCYDEEFNEYYQNYRAAKNVSGKEEEFLQAAFICCDNLYRRLVENMLPCDALMKKEGKIGFLDGTSVKDQVYHPNFLFCGSFTILQVVEKHFKAGKADADEVSVEKVEKHYRKEWHLSEEEQARIPDIPGSYRVSKDARNILEKVSKTKMRIFMLRGEAGTGKTTDVKIIARCLGLPYYYFGCGEGTEETDLLASYLPNTGRQASDRNLKVDWDDFTMNPEQVLADMGCSVEDGVSMSQAFTQLLYHAFEQGTKLAENEKDFLFVESELIKGCRRPAVVEIQEPAAIGRPGTLVKLNSLLDDCAVTTLSDGEVVRRNPDTIIILTTNAGYKGCRPIDQSVLSRMDLIIDTEPLQAKQMAERAKIRTGCSDMETLERMAEMMTGLKEQFEDVIAMGGVCGYREYENWVTGWMASKDMLGEARNAVVSKMTDQRETQDEILTTISVFMKPAMRKAA